MTSTFQRPTIDEFDSSDEEDIRNTVGNIPLQWYQHFAHIGYDTAGNKLIKPGVPADADTSSYLDPETMNSLLQLERILQTGGSGLDPETGRPMVIDPFTGQKVVLSEADVELLQNVAYGERQGKRAVANAGFTVGTTDEDGEEWFAWADESEVWDPTIAAPISKRRFLPSKYDRKRIGRMVHAMKMGWMLPPKRDVITESGPVELERALASGEQPDCIPDSVLTADGDLVFADVWAKDMNAPPEEPDDGFKLKFDPTKPPPPPRAHAYLRPPAEPLPGHELSYRPPPEYMLSTDEARTLKRNRQPNARATPLVPREYSWMRQLPWCTPYIYERFDRCRDLFMASRFVQSKVDMKADDLLPKMPSLADLRPFPNKLGLTYKCNASVYSVSVSPDGLFVACGTSASQLHIFEVATPRCFRVYSLRMSHQKGTHKVSVAWNPCGSSLHLLAAACGDTVHIINPLLDDHQTCLNTDHFLEECVTAQKETDAEDKSAVGAAEASDDDEDDDKDEKTPPKKRPRTTSSSTGLQCVTWSVIPAPADTKNKLHLEGRRFSIRVRSAKSPGTTVELTRTHWHPAGRYLLTSDDLEGVLLHHLPKMRSQRPFLHKAGSQFQLIEALFHPRVEEPRLFLGDQKHVRQVCLRQRATLRTLNPGLDYVTSMALHSSGLHLVVGGVEGQIAWFDLEMGQFPYKKLNLKQGAIRAVAMHPHRPLMAVATEQGSIVVFHITIPQDLLENVVIYPVQVIRAHTPQQSATNHGLAGGAWDCGFHPQQPFVFSGGADATLRQFVASH